MNRRLEKATEESLRLSVPIQPAFDLLTVLDKTLLLRCLPTGNIHSHSGRRLDTPVAPVPLECGPKTEREKIQFKGLPHTIAVTVIFRA